MKRQWIIKRSLQATAERQKRWDQAYQLLLRVQIPTWRDVEGIGIDKLLARLREGWQLCRYDLQPHADRARSLAVQNKVALHVTIRKSMRGMVKILSKKGHLA